VSTAAPKPETVIARSVMLDAHSIINALTAINIRNPVNSVAGSRSAATIGGTNALSTATVAATSIAPHNPVIVTPDSTDAASISATADTIHVTTSRSGRRCGRCGCQERRSAGLVLPFPAVVGRQSGAADRLSCVSGARNEIMPVP